MDTLDLLQKIYRSPKQPMSRRMRAIEALPFENLKLSATAIFGGDDFAARLERAITRSRITRSSMSSKVIALRPRGEKRRGD